MSGLGRIGITFEEVKTMANQMSSLAEEYRGCAKTMFSEGRVLNGSWQGQAHAAFDRLLASDEPRFMRLCDEIDKFGKAACASAQKYESADTEVANTSRRGRKA